MAEMIYLDTYVLQQDMRVRLPKACHDFVISSILIC